MVYSWPQRHDYLQQNLSDPIFRVDLFKIWHVCSSLILTPPHTYVEQQVLDWQITIGRALLDYPELDRGTIKTRVDELVRLKGN